MQLGQTAGWPANQAFSGEGTGNIGAGRGGSGSQKGGRNRGGKGNGFQHQQQNDGNGSNSGAQSRTVNTNPRRATSGQNRNQGKKSNQGSNPQTPAGFTHQNHNNRSAATISIQERYDNLKETREIERKTATDAGLIADPDKPRSLANAVVPVGTCPDMCAEYERLDRILSKDVWKCELMASNNNHQSSPEGRMVKKFRRAAAGLEQQLPSDLRPPAVLRKTVNFLFNDVTMKAPTLSGCHHFLWDRTRAIRNDFSIQQVSKLSDVRIAIECFERIARFHLLSLHQLSPPEPTADTYDWFQDREQLERTLLSLLQYYDDHRQHYRSENEAEFRAYSILLQIQCPVPDIEDRVQTWPLDIVRDARVQRALKIYNAATTITDQQGPGNIHKTNHLIAQENWRRFWVLIESHEVSYLMACAAAVFFSHVRRAALLNIWKSCKTGSATKKLEDWSVQSLVVILGLDSGEQVIDLCHFYDFSVQPKSDGSGMYLDLASVPNKTFPVEKGVMKQIKSFRIVEAKRYRRTIAAILNGVSVAEARRTGQVVPQDEPLTEVSNETLPFGDQANPVPSEESQSLFVHDSDSDEEKIERIEEREEPVAETSLGNSGIPPASAQLPTPFFAPHPAVTPTKSVSHGGSVMSSTPVATHSPFGSVSGIKPSTSTTPTSLPGSAGLAPGTIRVPLTQTMFPLRPDNLDSPEAIEAGPGPKHAFMSPSGGSWDSSHLNASVYGWGSTSEESGAGTVSSINGTASTGYSGSLVSGLSKPASAWGGTTLMPNGGSGASSPPQPSLWGTNSDASGTASTVSGISTAAPSSIAFSSGCLLNKPSGGFPQNVTGGAPIAGSLFGKTRPIKPSPLSHQIVANGGSSTPPRPPPAGPLTSGPLFPNSAPVPGLASGFSLYRSVADSPAVIQAKKQASLSDLSYTILLDSRSGFLKQYVEFIAGPIITEVAVAIEQQQLNTTADLFRIRKLMMRYGFLWLENVQRMKLRRRSMLKRQRVLAAKQEGARLAEQGRELLRLSTQSTEMDSGADTSALIPNRSTELDNFFRTSVGSHGAMVNNHGTSSPSDSIARDVPKYFNRTRTDFFRLQSLGITFPSSTDTDDLGTSANRHMRKRSWYDAIRPTSKASIMKSAIPNDNRSPQVMPLSVNGIPDVIDKGTQLQMSITKFANELKDPSPGASGMEDDSIVPFEEDFRRPPIETDALLFARLRAVRQALDDGISFYREEREKSELSQSVGGPVPTTTGGAIGLRPALSTSLFGSPPVGNSNGVGNDVAVKTNGVPFPTSSSTPSFRDSISKYRTRLHALSTTVTTPTGVPPRPYSNGVMNPSSLSQSISSTSAGPTLSSSAYPPRSFGSSSHSHSRFISRRPSVGHGPISTNNISGSVPGSAAGVATPSLAATTSANLANGHYSYFQYTGLVPGSVAPAGVAKRSGGAATMTASVNASRHSRNQSHSYQMKQKQLSASAAADALVAAGAVDIVASIDRNGFLTSTTGSGMTANGSSGSVYPNATTQFDDTTDHYGVIGGQSLDQLSSRHGFPTYMDAVDAANTAADAASVAAAAALQAMFSGNNPDDIGSNYPPPPPDHNLYQQNLSTHLSYPGRQAGDIDMNGYFEADVRNRIPGDIDGLMQSGIDPGIQYQYYPQYQQHQQHQQQQQSLPRPSHGTRQKPQLWANTAAAQEEYVTGQYFGQTTARTGDGNDEEEEEDYDYEDEDEDEDGYTDDQDEEFDDGGVEQEAYADVDPNAAGTGGEDDPIEL